MRRTLLAVGFAIEIYCQPCAPRMATAGTASPTATATVTASSTATATVLPRATPTPRPRPTPRLTAAVLYAASGTFGVQGILYTLDPATGVVLTTVGLLHDAAGNNYGMGGLKYHPITGIFYGAT